LIVISLDEPYDHPAHPDIRTLNSKKLIGRNNATKRVYGRLGSGRDDRQH
jgi:hypothetical protein